MELSLRWIRVFNLFVAWTQFCRPFSKELPSLLEQVDNPTPSLNTVFQYPLVAKTFCCLNQFNEVLKYIHGKNSFLDHITNSYDNTLLAQFIFNNREEFATHLNWRQLYSVLYSKCFSNIKRKYFHSPR